MQELIQFAEHLAKISGDVIGPYFRTDINIETKADESPVTIADKKAEETMREAIMKEMPEHGIIGEEFGDYQPDAEYQWVLDPIDGTKNFVAGSFLFGTLIALLHQGKPILGVIHHPLNQQLLIGADGKSTVNGKPAQVRSCDSIDDALVLSSSHWLAEKVRDGAAYEALTRRAKLYRTWGDSHGYFLLATGFADVMLDPEMAFWDLAALIPIVEGAGGKITDWYGGDPIKGDSIIATCNADLHQKVVRALNPK